MTLENRYSQSKNKFYLESSFSFANFTLLNGIFIIGFALALGANNLQLGILLAIPLFANLLQLTSAFILERTGTKKVTTLVSLLIGRIAWIPIILIAFGNITKKPLLILTIILLFSSIFNAIGNLSLLSWIKDIVPLGKLARFLGKRNMYASGAGIIVYIIGSYIIDKYEGIGIYGNLFLFALIIGILGLFYLIRIPERKQEIKAINPRKFIRRLCIPFKDKNFRPLLYFGLLSGFAINLSAPFFLVFMIDDLSLSFLIISLFLIIHTIARIYGLSIWRHLIDKFGAKPLLIVSSTVTSLIPLGFVFINNKNYFLIPLILALSAISYAAIDISIGKVLFKSATRKYDAYYLSTFTALTGLMSALGPIIGGLLAFLIKNNSYIPSINILSPLKYVFIISFIIRTSCIPLTSRIYEPKAKDINDIIERMKTLRFASFFVNIYNFADYTSKIVLVPQKQLFLLQRKTIERAKRDITNNILPVFSKISTSLNKVYKRLTPYGEKRITELKDTLTKEVDKLEYVEGGEMQKISQRVLSKMEALESSIEKDPPRVIKQKVKSIKKSIETSKEKLDRTYEKEVK